MSNDGDPDALASVSRRRDGIDEAMQPDAGVYHHASEFVFARQDAALRIIGVVTGMDADALKARNALQQGQPLLESRRLGDEQRIGALGYGQSYPSSSAPSSPTLAPGAHSPLGATG